MDGSRKGEGDQFNPPSHEKDGKLEGWGYRKLSDGATKVPIIKKERKDSSTTTEQQQQQRQPPIVNPNLKAQIPPVARTIPTITTPTIAKPIIKIGDYIPTCAICAGTIIEATAIISCGHVFCYDCIHFWKKYKNWCPICQKSLSYELEDKLAINFGCNTSKLVRIPELDNLIESKLGELPKDVKERFLKRREIRMEKARRERNSNGLTKRILKSMENTRLYFQSKGFFGGILRSWIMFWRNLFQFFNKIPFGTMLLIFFFSSALIMIGYIIGVSNPHSNLPKYLLNLWNAMTTYPVPVIDPPEPVIERTNIFKMFGSWWCKINYSDSCL